jgi:probable phosphoglycerate mutase
VTTTFFLVRHASHALLGHVLVGRGDVSLGVDGMRQAESLGRRLSSENVSSLQSSPSRRARETAHPIADATGLSVNVTDAVDEIDVGEWTGRTFAELEGDRDWQHWCSARAVARPPGGESMAEVQERIVGHLDRTRSLQPEWRVVVVSHADVIKAAILYYLGLSLDAYDRIDIGPASITRLVVADWGAKVLSLNESVAP